ncbi:MAG: S41 family peptidase [Deltaproteobacteria bacterium]
MGSLEAASNVRRQACAALGALAVGCAGPPPGPPPRTPVEADRWLGEDRAATFERHVDHIASIASLSSAGLARLGTTWDEELTEVERRYRDAVSRDDAYYALVALKNSLHDGHAFLVADALAPEAPIVRLPVSIRVESDGTEARYVARAGGPLPAGGLVLAVDDTPIGSIERSHRPWFEGGSSPEGLREDVARWLAIRDPRREPAPAPGARTTLLVRAEDGTEQTFALSWQAVVEEALPCPPYAAACAPDADGDYEAEPTFEGLGACVYATDDPETRVVRYHTLYTPDTFDPRERACLERKLPELSYRLTLDDADALGPRGLLQRDQGELLDHLARAGVRRVLFDVRENRGGDFDPVFFGAFTEGTYAQPLKSFVFGDYFREAPERIREANVYVALASGEPIDGAAARIEQYLRDMPDAQRSEPWPFYCQSRACDPSEATLRSESSVVFQAAVLTGPRCFSACDDFVAIFRDNGIAATIGQPTGAGDAPYSFDTALALADGSEVALRLTVGVSFHPGTDTPLEGHPAPIDVPLAPTADNRGGLVRAALSRAPW